MARWITPDGLMRANPDEASGIGGAGTVWVAGAPLPLMAVYLSWAS